MIKKLFSQGLMGIAVVALSALSWSVARSAEAPVLDLAPRTLSAAVAPADPFHGVDQ
ncbi:hypothetical protein [Rhodospirillum sp. A1_3_36]|uniref:hypothetical protein n=1 Tax=Rhodospirillum sp. A1_3_36 TaxID=3391666 RepID=UPI0039A403C4